jgi:hypothetical protein
MSKINEGAGIDLDQLGIEPSMEQDPRDAEMAAMRETIRKLIEQNQVLAIARNDTEPTVAGASNASSKERFGIIIDEGHDQNDISEVPVQVNGRAYQIKRGQYVEVPIEVISVLKDAVIDRSIAQFDATGMPAGIKVRPSRRFPFQEFGMAINAQGERVREPQPQTV